MEKDQGLCEAVAECLHELWGEWTKDLLRDCEPLPENFCAKVISAATADDLQWRIATPYVALTFGERDDYRCDASRILDLLSKQQ